VSRGYLAQERDLAYREAETPDCRRAGCQDCGVCDQEKIILRLNDPVAPGALAAGTQGIAAADSPASPPGRYRLTYAKLEEARWLSHLELVAAIYRALRRSGLPLAFSSGFHPLPRVSFHGALSVGVESLGETMDVELTRHLEEPAVLAGLNRVLPRGVKILEAVRLPGRVGPPRFDHSVYQVASPAPVFGAPAAANFLARETFPVTRRRPKETREVDLRPRVAKLLVTDPCYLELHLKIMEKDNLRTADALAAVFSLTDDQTRSLRIVKIKSL
jgi:radical SAM-linked protein